MGNYILLESSLPALNLATFLAFIFITSPVCGLRPLRAALLDTEKVPKPTNVTLPPPFNVFVTASIKESKEAFACVFVMPASSASYAINSALFMIYFFNVLVREQIYRVFHSGKIFYFKTVLFIICSKPLGTRI